MLDVSTASLSVASRAGASSAHSADAAAGLGAGQRHSRALDWLDVELFEDHQDAPVDVANVPVNSISWGHVVGTSREDGTNTSISASSTYESSGTDSASKQTGLRSRHSNPGEIGAQSAESQNVGSSGSSLSIRGTSHYHKLTGKHILFAGSRSVTSDSQSNKSSGTRSLSGSSACRSKSVELGNIQNSFRVSSNESFYGYTGVLGTQSDSVGDHSVSGMPFAQAHYALGSQRANDDGTLISEQTCEPDQAARNYDSDTGHLRMQLSEQPAQAGKSAEVDTGELLTLPLGENVLPSESAIEHPDDQMNSDSAQEEGWETGEADIDELLESIDMEELMKRVPLDEKGLPTSIGSVGHFNNSCYPCYYAQGAKGCSNGIRCNFCHFRHAAVRKSRPRPCKSKRDSYRAHWEVLRQQIEANPDEFDVETAELPPQIRGLDRLKVKLKNRMKSYQELLRSQTSKPQEQEDEAPLVESPRRSHILAL